MASKTSTKKRVAKEKSVSEVVPVVPIDVPTAEIVPVEVGPKRCPACVNGQSLEKGEGAHILGSVEHPVEQVRFPPYSEPSIASQNGRKRIARPLPKEFRGASSYAEKRLAKAIKERAKYMGLVAVLNAEIPSLVQVIRALGGNANIAIGQMQAFAAPISMDAVVDPYANLPNNVDPALIQANSGPVPVPQTPLIPNTANGGAMDLDYTPVVEEGPPLPRMGGGWV
jgi:hypothetical protein